MESKYERVSFHYENFIKYNMFSVGLGSVKYCRKSVYAPNSGYTICSVPVLEALVHTHNDKLVKDVLTLPINRFGTNIKLDQLSHDAVFQFTVAHDLTHLQNILIDYFTESIGKPPLMSFTSAIMYDQPGILEKLIRYKYRSRGYVGLTSEAEQRCITLCEVMHRQNCKEVLCRYGKHEQNEELRPDFLAKILLELVGTHGREFSDEMGKALHEIPNFMNKVKSILQLTTGDKRTCLVKMLTELCVCISTKCTCKTNKGYLEDHGDILYNGTYEDFFRIISCKCIWHTGVRKTADVLIDANLNLDIEKFVVKYYLYKDSFTANQDAFILEYNCEMLYQTDRKEHGYLGYKDGDFALNFTAPFLLECGFPTIREVIEIYLKTPLNMHPTERDYLRNYVQNYFDGPKPLTETCRDVLRKHFRGQSIHKYMVMSLCPEKLKYFILMKYLFHNQCHNSS